MMTSPRSAGREAFSLGFILLLVQTASPLAVAAPVPRPPVPTAPAPAVLPPPPAAPLPEAESRRHLRYAEREAR
jgi:hypothetical protein